MLLEPGRLVGAYEILEPLGHGGMGEVYRARHTRLGMLAAIKVVSARLDSDPAAAERLNREARLASSLNHPAIVSIHDIGETEGRPFIVMELIDGEPLSARLAAGPMKAHDALELACQVADGLAAAHGAGVVHRDLKPRNIMVTSDGHRAKIVDFGLSKAAPVTAGPDDLTHRLPEDLTAPHTVLGSVGYMAPEQVSGRQATFQSDQFALGVVLYEMLTGRRAFRRDTAWQTVAAIAGEDPTPLAEVCPLLPPQLVTVVERCLAKRPNDRYGSTWDLARDLASVRHRLTSGPHPVPVPPQPAPSPSEPAPAPPTPVRYWRRAVAVILVLALAGAAYAFYARGPVSPPAFKQVAVLPFTCADPNDQVSCDGLVEALTIDLARLSGFDPSLRVVSQDLLRRDKVSSPQMARSALGATASITGVVDWREAATEVTLTRTDEAGVRSRSISVVQGREASMQREVVTAAAKLLEVTLSRSIWASLRAWWDGRTFAVSAPIDAGGTAVPRAYLAYLKGHGYLHSGKAEDAERAIEVLVEAVQSDSEYALAHAALCEAYWRTKDRERASRARASCQNALQIDAALLPAQITMVRINRLLEERSEAVSRAMNAVKLAGWSSDARHELGAALEDAGRFDEAEAAYSEALRDLPEDSQIYSDLCRFYVVWGNQSEKPLKRTRFDKAREECQHAAELTPDSIRVLNNLGATYYFLELYAEGAIWYQKSMDVRSNSTAAAMLGLYDYRRGDYVKAVSHYEEAVNLAPSLTDPITTYHGLGAAYWASGAGEAKWTSAYEEVARRILAAVETNKTTVTELTSPRMLGQFADSCAMLGRTDDARLALDALEHLAVDDNGVMFLVASAYGRVEDRPSALRWLTRAVASGYPCDQVNTSPFLKELRKDQQYERVGCR